MQLKLGNKRKWVFFYTVCVFFERGCGGLVFEIFFFFENKEKFMDD